MCVCGGGGHTLYIFEGTAKQQTREPENDRRLKLDENMGA